MTSAVDQAKVSIGRSPLTHRRRTSPQPAQNGAAVPTASRSAHHITGPQRRGGRARHSGSGTTINLPERREHGVIGGLEVLPFGVLVFVSFGLVIANAWAVVDAKLAVESAAREAGRAYVEAHDPGAAPGEATAAALAATEAAGRDPTRLILTAEGGAYQRCAVVEHAARYRVPALTIPFIGSFGSGITVTGTHRSVVDPYASGVGRRNLCGF
ncbi:MAG: hypothetical protein WBB52_07750 [Acidimicrobiales bacterium]|jgi:hypothetical protein